MQTIAALSRRLKALEHRTAPIPAILESVRKDPATIFRAAGKTPDQWQADLIRCSDSRVLMLASRQSGKSQTAAALALRSALLEAPALVLLLSPTLRQSGELFRDKVLPLWRALGCPYRDRAPTQLSLELANGSRVISLPGEEGTIRGFSGVKTLVIDEACRVPDSLYFACRPMLAISRGRLICLSSAYAKQGWFYQTYTGDQAWRRVKVTAPDCPRISKEFLREERLALGERWFAMEYLCEWGELVDAVFRQEDIDRAFGNQSVTPLFEQPEPDITYKDGEL
jgi:hypothetical protein